MAARKKGTVGVVGLGIMGGSFAKNLVESGWRVLGYDIDAKRRRALARAGVEIAPDVATLAQAVPTIITSLPSPRALDAVVAEITGTKRSPKVIIEASTFTLDDKVRAERALKKAGHMPLDCPISGTGAQAAVKDLVVYASGDTKTVARLKPLFLGFSRAVHDLGAFGNGSRMKYVANLLVAIHNVATAEAMVLGIKAGLDPRRIFDLVKIGAGNSRVFELRAPMMVKDNYDAATMKIKVWQKDMDVIGSYAAALGVPTPLFSATIPIYASAMSMGHGAQDTAAVCAVLEAMAGVKRSKTRRKRR
ncbi:MAG TPA: NAD(P)-dependent oxidoreductase [Xanthobacteraceae bacterium]|jgi:3-hydroxyisobutyrate dehydrogenase-like beta-hydroxyacid dehydrogenase